MGELISGTYQYSVKAVYKTGESIEAYSEDIERSEIMMPV